MSLEFDKVVKSFGPKHILRGVSFKVEKGEIFFVLGKSGVGKSVTLKHLVGVLKPDSGNVIVDGDTVNHLSERELTRVRRKCGMVFQHPALLDSLTIYDNVSFGLRTPQFIEANGRKLSEDEIRAIVIEKLALVHLDQSVLYKKPPEISYGMQKRVSLARTLAPGPSYLLFDEPTTGLDPITTMAVNDLIFELSRKLNVTSIVVSHDMLCALKIADRILVLDGGHIMALGDVETIKKSEIPLIKDFLSEALEILPTLGPLPRETLQSTLK